MAEGTGEKPEEYMSYPENLENIKRLNGNWNLLQMLG